MVRNLLEALKARSWDDFARYFDDSSLVFLNDDLRSERTVTTWAEVRDSWQQAFKVRAPPRHAVPSAIRKR